MTSPRGRLRVSRIDVAGVLDVDGAVALNATTTINFLALGGTGTDPVLYGNAQTIVSQNPLAAKPSAAIGAAIGIVSNSTGVGLVVNTGTTTWKWLSTTTLQPT